MSCEHGNVFATQTLNIWKHSTLQYAEKIVYALQGSVVTF